MWVADLDFKTPECVREALRDRVDFGIFGYSYVPDSYYESLNNWMTKYHNYNVKKEWVRSSNGVLQAMYYFIQAFTEEDDSIILLTPVYHPFHIAIRDTNRRLITCELSNNNGKYSVNYDYFEQSIIDGKVKMYIHCSPHNPTGKVWTEEEQEKIFAICEKHDVLIVSDEIHQDFVYEPNKHIPAALVGNGKYINRLVTATAASKSFNLAALIQANIIIPDENLRLIYDSWAKQNLQIEHNTLGLTATEVAYREGREWFEALKEVIYQNYTYAKDELQKNLPNIEIAKLEGTYLMFIDLGEYLLDGETVEEFIQDRCDLAIDPGRWFSQNYQTYVRINLATKPEIVETAIANIIREAKINEEKIQS